MKEHNPRVRLLIQGRPKSGKTGSLAALVNSGRYHVRILDFDGNTDPLHTFVDPSLLSRVSVVTCSDKLRDDGKRIVVSGEPTAFRNSHRAIDKWVDDEGRDFGAVKDWGDDVVLVLDSLPSMGEAAFRRRRHYRSAGGSGEDTISDWGAAIRDQSAMIEILASPRFSCHVLVLCHIKEPEPKIVMESAKDSADVKAAKGAISRLRAENWEPRKFPNALGTQLPQEIARFLPGVVLVDGDRGGKRVFVTAGEPDMDLGVPCKGLPRTLPLETGLLTIFEAILGGENAS